jgi:hypothetical protein
MFELSQVDKFVNKDCPMTIYRLLRQSVSRLPVRPALVGVAVFAAGLVAAGTYSSAIPAAPQDVCLPAIGCVSTSVPSATLPTVTLPTTTTTTTTTPGGGTTTVAGSGGDPGGSTTSTGTTTTTATDASGSPSFALRVTVTVLVRGHRAKRAIELRLRLSKPARVSALLSRQGKALKRLHFSARAGSSVWRLRLGRTMKAGAARLGLTYRSASGEIARTAHRLRLPR